MWQCTFFIRPSGRLFAPLITPWSNWVGFCFRWSIWTSSVFPVLRLPLAHAVLSTALKNGAINTAVYPGWWMPQISARSGSLRYLCHYEFLTLYLCFSLLLLFQLLEAALELALIWNCRHLQPFSLLLQSVVHIPCKAKDIPALNLPAHSTPVSSSLQVRLKSQITKHSISKPFPLDYSQFLTLSLLWQSFWEPVTCKYSPAAHLFTPAFK